MDENSSQSSTVLEPEIIEDGSKATILINLESMIKTNLGAISRLQEEVKKHKGLLDDIFNNDPTYKQHTDQAKEAARIKSATKMQILKQPQAADLSQKLKTMQSELKEMQGSLSDYLQQFAQMSGLTEIEGDDGEIRQIIYVAKLIKKTEIFRQ
jgi:hypothetical protein